MSTRAALGLLALASLFLSRRSSPYRPLSASLLLLAAIDLARLVTAPHAALREWGWWQADVALCALWPVAIGVGLLAAEHVKHRRVGHVYSNDGEDDSCHDAREKRYHLPILSRLASLCSLAILIGALRPHLPRLLYLTGLRLPRWALAGLWVEVVLLAVGHLRQTRNPTIVIGIPLVARRELAGDKDEEGVTPKVGVPDAHETHHAPTLSRAPLACSLILAACNTADLLAGAWDVAPWQPPAWQYARACTWAAYVAVGVVMGWEVAKWGR